MTQIISGIRSIVSNSAVYNCLQSLLGANKARKQFVSYLDLHENDRILDIGCGTAELLGYLPKDIIYIGFDASEEYIKAAKRKYGNRGEFVAKSVTDALVDEYEDFDRVIASLVLHHLKDDEVLHIFKLAKNALKHGGMFCSLDCCYTTNQSIIPKTLIDLDRGQNVRRLHEYEELAISVFQEVKVFHRTDMLRIPYDHVVLVCR
jgi:SAM-dependent methyltransferase